MDELYQELILDHYRRPRNRGRLDGADRTAELHNPLCGDEIVVDLKLEGETVAEIRFDGHGCAISQASASMMTERVKGRSVGEARAAIELFRSLMRGEGDIEKAADFIGDLVALGGVRRFPVRIKCATLPWNALALALEGRRGEEAAEP